MVVRESHLVVVEVCRIVVESGDEVAVEHDVSVLEGVAAAIEVDAVAPVQSLVADETDVADRAAGGLVDDAVGVAGGGRFVSLQDVFCVV